MKVSESTNVQMPLKTVVSLITLVSVGTWAYFGVIARLTQVETALILTEKDLEKNTEFRIKWPRGEMGQLPADNEQYMLLYGIQKEMESMMSNTVNIDFLKKQVAKLQDDVEKLKDKVRNNGGEH